MYNTTSSRSETVHHNHLAPGALIFNFGIFAQLTVGFNTEHEEYMLPLSSFTLYNCTNKHVTLLYFIF